MEQEVEIRLREVVLKGTLALPQRKSLVIFAHGSGSSRLSPRNRYVAGVMQEAGLGTLLFDLLTKDEDAVYARRFDIDLLARRLMDVTQWLSARPELRQAAFGYFGASTGAAAALQAAALQGSTVKAVVSRGGRADLAMPYLDKVSTPTLLVVGERDPQVLHLNRLALERLAAGKELAVIPGATHLFEEPGTLEQVAAMAREWFLRFLQ